MKKKRRKTRKKRAGSSWFKCIEIAEGKVEPTGAEETKCCCNTYSCRNNRPDLCPSLVGKVGQAIKSKYEDWSEKAREQSNEKKDEKKKKVFEYHTNRKKNQGEKEGSYGSPCKNKDGELWGQVKPRLGTKLFMGGPGIPCEGSDRTCKLAENNPSGVPIQHYTNWLAPAKAFEQPPAEYMPGKIDNEGLACRPDAGLDLWGHPHADRKSFEGKGEWCRLDPVRRGFKSNKSKSNRQTCLTAANKNLFASSLSAKDAGRYFMDEDGLKKKLENIWTETERIKKEATKKFAADYKKKLVADKKKLVADKVQAQAHAFGEKQKGNNAEFFNAQSGNEFFDAQSGGHGRKRRKKRTRRRRSRRRHRSRRRRGGAPRLLAPTAHIHLNPNDGAIALVPIEDQPLAPHVIQNRQTLIGIVRYLELITTAINDCHRNGCPGEEDEARAEIERLRALARGRAAPQRAQPASEPRGGGGRRRKKRTKRRTRRK